MRDYVGDVNNPIWELLKRFPGYQFSMSHSPYDFGETVMMLTVTNRTGSVRYRKYLTAWCLLDSVTAIEQLVYHFEECAKEVYKKENK